MARPLSVGRIWILAGVLFAIAMILMVSTQDDPESRTVGIVAMMISSLVLMFAIGYSLYRLVRWSFSRQADSPPESVSQLTARLEGLERNLTVKQLNDRVAELERQLAEAKGTETPEDRGP